MSDVINLPPSNWLACPKEAPYWNFVTASWTFSRCRKRFSFGDKNLFSSVHLWPWFSQPFQTSMILHQPVHSLTQLFYPRKSSPVVPLQQTEAISIIPAIIGTILIDNMGVTKSHFRVYFLELLLTSTVLVEFPRKHVGFPCRTILG